jgi:hypothetical protein
LKRGAYSIRTFKKSRGDGADAKEEFAGGATSLDVTEKGAAVDYGVGLGRIDELEEGIDVSLQQVRG